MIELRSILTALYPDPRQQRVLLTDLGVAVERVSFDGSAQVRWAEILTELARSEGGIEALVERALTDYPGSQRLSAWKDAWNNERPRRLVVAGLGEHGPVLAERFARRLLPRTLLGMGVELVDGDPLAAETAQGPGGAVRPPDRLILCVEAAATRRAAVHFALGAAVGRGTRVLLVLCGTGPAAPPRHPGIVCVRGDDADELVPAIASLAQLRADSVRDTLLPEKFDAWNQEQQRALDRAPRDNEPAEPLRELRDAFDRIGILEHRLNEHDTIARHRGLAAIIVKAIRELTDQLVDMGDRFVAPAALYPQYLVHLQHRLHARVDAIAMVNQEEHFWNQKESRDILHSISPLSRSISINGRPLYSRRIFVFTGERDLQSHLDTLISHSTHDPSSYRVGAISHEKMIRVLDAPFRRDYSIIDAGGGHLLARYDTVKSSNLIQFVTDEELIQQHQERIEKLWRYCIKVDGASRTEAFGSWLEGKVFRSGDMTVHEQRPVEMSAYIPIDDYDEQEEKHAYYQEMMAEMIAQIRGALRERAASASPHVRALELGAGTGIFTRRLLDCSELTELVAVEIDWTCYRKLDYTVRKKLKLIQQEQAAMGDTAARLPRFCSIPDDSRTYDAPGTFDFILSSFADHHIRLEDKQIYFQNVRKNLKEGGLFIVGDEFLPPHDRSDEAARRTALERYHRHIIEIAEREGHHVLAELERKAWESGKEMRGDFKLSRDQYEHELRKAGLRWREVIRIGPKDIDDVGGIFVYIIDANHARAD